MLLCKNCQTEFQPQHGRQAHCSVACRTEFFRKTERVRVRAAAADTRSNTVAICLNCAVEYHPHFYQCDRQRFCTENCKIEWHKNEKLKKMREAADLSPRICCYCAKSYVPDYNPNHERQIYCSNLCKKQYHKEQAKLKAAAIRAGTTKTCPICDRDFAPKKTLREIYCSKSCQKSIGRKIYKMMASCYEKCGTSKEDQSHVVLGYSPKELLEHLQKFPQWDKLKLGAWHLDHIFPIIAFVRKGIHDPAIICHLTNLQPLSGFDNCSKNDNYDDVLFSEWIKTIV